MTHRPSDLLRRPAVQSVRVIALGYLDEARVGLERLSDPQDREALHDFRVALRRLRTTLRAYQPIVRDSVSRTVRHRLRDLADVTNPARDAEVALAWLRPLDAELQSRDRIGLRALVERIEHRRTKHRLRSLTQARRSFADVERKLRKALGPSHGDPRASQTLFGSVAAATLLEQAQRLDRLLASVSGPDDEVVHQARIAAKRLRYQMEPVAGALAGGSRLTGRLRRLQDLLGELHDLVQLQDEVQTEPEAAAVSRRVRARRVALFADLKRAWLGSAAGWTRDVTAATAPLSRSRRAGAPSWRRPRRARTV